VTQVSATRRARTPTHRDRLEYAALRLAVGFFRILPRRTALRVGAAVGELFFRLDARDRRVALQNLAIAFPEKRPAERNAILRRSCHNLGRMAAEICHLRSLTSESVRRYVDIENPQLWQEGLRRGTERGLLVLTGHVGNFELLAYAHGLLGHPIALVHRPMRNPLVEELIRDLRAGAGTVSLAKSTAARQALRLLRQRQIVAIPADQNQVARTGVFADFFGLPACTTPGPVRLAMRTGALVQPVFLVRAGSSERHRIVVLPEVEMVDSGDPQRDVITNTERCNRALEEILRIYPEQWIWFHKRWKTRPPGEPKLY